MTLKIRKSYLTAAHYFPFLNLLIFRGVLVVLGFHASLGDPVAPFFLFFLFYREVPGDLLVHESLVDLEVQCDLIKSKYCDDWSNVNV